MMRRNIRFNYSFYVGAVLVSLLWLKCALAEEGSLPPLQTLAAQSRLGGIAEPGQDPLVTKVYALPDGGPRFVKLRFDENTELWMEFAGEAAVGHRLVITKRAYLFTEPVAEEAGEESAEDSVGKLGLRSRQGLNAGKLGISGACNRFIGGDGSFGAWGTYLMGKLNRAEHPNLFAAAADTARVCPKFSKMGDDERKNFLTWFVASMAAFESGCNEKVKARGVNGTAAGLLQLHLGKEANYGCRRGMNSLDARANLECGLHMLDNDVARTRKLFPSGGGYWQVLRPQSAPGKRTLRVTKAYGPCF
ncbi:MAG: hypothetical protein EOP11_23825 [Proteobacteria bacterium]|nr:MAG: hypothetical protein EOP11_23825 [Pseudomonadota bacterium]